MPYSGPHARNPGRVLTLAMMNSALGTGLRTELPDLEVHVSAGDLAAYSYDGTAALMARPSAVVSPRRQSRSPVCCVSRCGGKYP